jgi:hypothetical protein
MDLTEIIKLESSIQIATQEFYISTMSRHPMTAKDLFDDHDSPTRDEGVSRKTDISRNERRRLRRAWHRYETSISLFGRIIYHSPENLPCATYWNISQSRTCTQIKEFFSKLEIWEVDEIICVRDFVFRYYDKIFVEFKAHFLEFFRGLQEQNGGGGPFSLQAEPNYLNDEMEQILIYLGTHFLADVAKETNPKTMLKKLERPMREHWSKPRLASPYFSDILKRYFKYPSKYGPVFLPYYLPEEWQKMLAIQFSTDWDEAGPNAAWRWSLDRQRNSLMETLFAILGFSYLG